jgi:hypothetical protein
MNFRLLDVIRVPLNDFIQLPHCMFYVIHLDTVFSTRKLFGHSFLLNMMKIIPVYSFDKNVVFMKIPISSSRLFEW